MNEIYRFVGCSKQAFHQKMNRRLVEREQLLLLLPLIAQLRADHPGMAARQLYFVLRPEHIGRDKFEEWCFENGYKLQRKKAYKRTTDSTGVEHFDNLIFGMEFTAVNQAWSSDITYYQIGEDCYYLTFIVDLFSRRIVGFNVSRRLLTDQTTIPALQMALKERKPVSGLIFHSDGGGQYYCKEFLKITAAHGIRNSMCEVVYENAHAERINGTIKNQYLKGYNPSDYLSLVKLTKKAVHNYNYIRPHSALNKMSPAAFEKLMPAGGASPSIDHFCNKKTYPGLHQKNNQSPVRLIRKPKPVEKTVNVI